LAALAAAAPAAAQQTSEKAFCLSGAQSAGQPGAAPECRFDTMAQCEAAARGISTAKCAPNPKGQATPAGQMKK
jgi:hypothetical protein